MMLVGRLVKGDKGEGLDLTASKQIKKKGARNSKPESRGREKGTTKGGRKGRGNNDSACRNTYDEEALVTYDLLPY
jgi:hypothetical protein